MDSRETYPVTSEDEILCFEPTVIVEVRICFKNQAAWYREDHTIKERFIRNILPPRHQMSEQVKDEKSVGCSHHSDTKDSADPLNPAVPRNASTVVA